jgi:hypothetical protein
MKSTDDFTRFFVDPPSLSDLRDEMQSRKEAVEWDLAFVDTLKPCPCCHAKAEIRFREMTNTYKIACSHHLCKITEAQSLNEARKIWNEPNFREGKA